MTDIEWVLNPDGSPGYTSNPITGCLNHVNGLCKGGDFPCYAYKLAHGRLKPRYLRNLEIALPHENPKLAFDDPFYPRFWNERLNHLIFDLGRKPKGIFLCDMGDLFGVGIPDMWTRKVIAVCNVYPQHRFYLLTKQPQRLPEFSPFPDNAWVGVTATNLAALRSALVGLEVIKAKVKFLSMEPLLEHIDIHSPYNIEYSDIQWLIIGACTGSLEDIKKANYAQKDTDGLMPMPWGKKWTLQPPIEGLQEIIQAADKAGVKVFLKNNLSPLIHQDMISGQYALDTGLLNWDGQLRQEVPK